MKNFEIASRVLARHAGRSLRVVESGQPLHVRPLRPASDPRHFWVEGQAGHRDLPFLLVLAKISEIREV
jgi:hypothetical protein